MADERAHTEESRPSAAESSERKRVYFVERTVTDRFFYDPDEIKREFGWDLILSADKNFEDFVIETFEQHDGSLYADRFFYNDASTSVGTELVEMWDDE